MTIVGVGLMISLVGALAATRLMAGLPYGVSAHDLLAHGAMLVLLAGAGFMASYIPARQAMSVDPVVALRYE